MSSINSSDRNSADEQIRRTRDAYQARESETAKRQKTEVKNLTEAHQAELEKVRESHAGEIETLKGRTKEAITKRDMRYQKEIDDLREMHQKQRMKEAVESDGRTARVIEGSKSEIEKVRAVGDQQRENVKKTLLGEIAERDRMLAEQSVEARERFRSEVGSVKENLNKAHEKEIKAVAQSREEALGDLKNQYSALREAKDEQIKSLDRNFASQTKRRQVNQEATISSERMDAKVAIDNQREGFERGLEKNRERYRDALADARGEMSDAREGLAKTADDRINGRVVSLESDYQRLKHDLVRARVDGEAQKHREVANARDGFAKNIEVYERERKEIVGATNENTKREIARVNEANERALVGSNNYFQDKIANEDIRTGERFAGQKLDFEKRAAHAEIRTEDRFGRLKSASDAEAGRQRAYFENAASAMRENFDTSLREMRSRNAQEQQRLFAQFAQQSAESDRKSQQKLAETTARFEQQMAEMNERHQKELKELQTLSERKLKETEKRGQQETQTVSSQLSYRISKNEELHKNELEDMRRKHEEALANLTKTRQT